VSAARRTTTATALALAAALTQAACTSTVVPPENVQEPATVFLLGEAMHAGVVLPPGPDDGEYVEFGFGDWSWFALGNDAWYHAFATVLWPTQGALGRRTFGARTPDELRARVTWATLGELRVEASLAHALRTRLQAAHDARAAEAVRRTDLGWTFVPYDRFYWFGVNCTDVTAEWLRELACRVHWVPIRTGLRVAQQPN
jgi:hypothetical protein